jgi:glutathione S-transferase
LQQLCSRSFPSIWFEGILSFTNALAFAWQTVDFADHPHVKRWYLTIAERPADKRGWDMLKEGRAIPLP